jgi:hypothetical protein
MALLYQISHFVKLSAKQIPTDVSKTSVPQAWHKPRIEGVSAEPIMHIEMHKSKRDIKQFPSTLYEARAPNAITNDGDLLTSVQHQLSQENPLYGLHMVNKETGNTDYCRTQLGTYVPRGSPLSYQLSLTEGNFDIDCHIMSLDHFRCTEGCVVRGIDMYPVFPLDTPGEPELDNDLSPEFLQVIHSLSVDQDQSKEIELKTRDQANSDQWWEERKLRITASNFAEICNRKKDNCKKFVERLQGKPSLKVPLSIKHGKDHEHVGIRKYHQYMIHTGHKVDIQSSGLVVRSDLPYLGCSPDGKVVDPISHPHFGIIEVKCPYKYRGIKPKEAAGIDKDFCLHVSPTGVLSLRQNHSYYFQVQGQMALTGASWCDFVVYTFKGLFIERIKYNSIVWNNMLHKLKTFYFKSFLPNATL